MRGRIAMGSVVLTAVLGSTGAVSAQPDDTIPTPPPPVVTDTAPSEPVAAPEPIAPEPIAPEPHAPEPTIVPAAAPRSDLGFGFGSYGRIGVGTDLRGSTPEPVNVVKTGTRIVEASYTELDLYYRLQSDRGVKVRTVTTLAAAGDPFHYTGKFDADMALRNLYAEAEHGSVNLWVGSRLYRGDDIYLLDYWPLDDLNTIGGGVGYRDARGGAAIHVGANRLLDPFQYQERPVADPEFGAVDVVELDRQRMVASAKGDYRVWGDGVGPSVKAKLYVELQSLPEGTRTRQDESIETLPSDFGYTVGAQLGAWGFTHGRSHANLFARWSQGLTAFDELQLPEGFDATRRTFPDASELLFALSGNYEFPGGGMLVGAYSRRFVDADPNMNDRDDGWEYIVDIRPHLLLVDDVELGVDVSYQARFPRGLSPTTLTALDPAVVQLAPMLIYSPFGTGSYARPQLRLVYRAAHLNEGARDLYPLDDRRRGRSWVHFLGLQAEWWFNSTYR